MASFESYAFEAVRRCRFVEFGRLDTGLKCAFAVLAPPVSGSAFGYIEDVTEVVLIARHEGVDLEDIREFPCFVHVAKCRTDWGKTRQVEVRLRDLSLLAWAELYRTKEDAEQHRFDRKN